MFNASTMCHTEEDMQLEPYFKSPLTWVATISAWFFIYARPIFNIYNSKPNMNDMRLLAQLAMDLARFIFLPMLYAYLWRPVTPVPKITIQAPSTDRETMTGDEYDPIDKSILLSLARNPSGCTARMIHQRIGPMYPELERNDVVKRLEQLTANNRAAILPSNLTSLMWISVKVKSH
jgi:hypothetical protein